MTGAWLGLARQGEARPGKARQGEAELGLARQGKKKGNNMERQVKEHPEWKELLEKFRNSSYGTLVAHELIEDILGLTRAKAGSKYYGIVNRWKKGMLEEASRQIECTAGKGYRIVKPEEFRYSATKQIKFGYRRMKKAGKIITQVPLDLLVDAEKEKVGQQSAILAQILHFGKSTLKKVNEIDKKTDKLLLDVGKALDVGD